MKAYLSLILKSIVLTSISFFAFSEIYADNTDKNSVAKNEGSVLIISTDSGKGTGFFLRIKNETYIISNAHVIGTGKGLSIKTLNGNEVSWDLAEGCISKDIIRLRVIKLPDGAVPLEYDYNTPSIDDKVEVYGNSQGANVITRLEGVLKGVGPDEIEVDAKFVSGNSGSPIINNKGDVIGIATYVTRSNNPNNWVIKDTRFAKTRRYGIRLTNVDWKAIDLKRIEKEYIVIKDLESYIYELALFLPKWLEVTDSNGNVLDQEAAKKRFREYDYKNKKEEYESDYWPKSLHGFSDIYHLATENYYEVYLRKFNENSTVYKNTRRGIQKNRSLLEKYFESIDRELRDILTSEHLSSYYARKAADDLFVFSKKVMELYGDARKSNVWLQESHWWSGLYQRSKLVDSIDELDDLSGR